MLLSNNKALIYYDDVMTTEFPTSSTPPPRLLRIGSASGNHFDITYFLTTSLENIGRKQFQNVNITCRLQHDETVEKSTAAAAQAVQFGPPGCYVYNQNPVVYFKSLPPAAQQFLRRFS